MKDAQELFTENYKTLLRKIQEDLNEDMFMFMDWNGTYC